MAIPTYDPLDFYGSDGSYPDLPASTAGANADTAALQRAIDAAVRYGGEVHIGLNEDPSEYWDVNRTLIISPERWSGFNPVPSINDEVSIAIKGQGARSTLKWVGATNQPVIKLQENAHNVRFDTLNVESNIDGVTGFLGHGFHKKIEFFKCHVAILTSADDNVGFAIGVHSGDANMIVFDQCSVHASYSGGYTGSAAFLYGTVGVKNHVGFYFLGSNTLINTVRSCDVQGCEIAYSVRNMFSNYIESSVEAPNGNSSPTFIDANANYCGLVFCFPGGTTQSITGGRAEHCGALMAVGGRTAGNEDGQFSISNYIFDSAHNGSNAHTNLNYVDNGVIIGFHCAGSLIMKNCRFDTADTGTAKIVDVKCSSAVNQRFISLEGCYRKNYTSALDWSAESTWDSWIDGTVAFTVIFNGIVLSPD